MWQRVLGSSCLHHYDTLRKKINMWLNPRFKSSSKIKELFLWSAFLKNYFLTINLVQKRASLWICSLSFPKSVRLLNPQNTYDQLFLFLITCFKPMIYFHTSWNHLKSLYPTNIYLLKFNNKNTKRRCQIYPKLTIKTPETRLPCSVQMRVTSFWCFYC